MTDENNKNDKTAEFVASIKGGFKVVFNEPNISTEKSDAITHIKSLHKERISIINQYKGTDRFKIEIGKISGTISGVVRSHRNLLMTTILMDIRNASPLSFEKFTLTTWREFALTLFGNAPAKTDLLTLLDDNHRSTGKRFTPNGWYPKKAVELLLADHHGTVAKIRKFHDDYVAQFHDETQMIKAKFDSKI